MLKHAELYTQDFYAWTQEQAALLREGAWHELDRAHLSYRVHSAPHGRRFDWQATATPGDEQFKIDVCIGAGGIGFSPHRGVTPGKHAMRGAEGLPGVAVDGKAIALALAHDVTTQALAGVAIVAVCTGKVELAAALHIQRFAGFEERLGGPVDAHIDRQTARLQGHKGGEREEGFGLVRVGGGVHTLGAAVVDLLLQVDELATLGLKAGIAWAHAPHARSDITVTAPTRCASGTVCLLP